MPIYKTVDEVLAEYIAEIEPAAKTGDWFYCKTAVKMLWLLRQYQKDRETLKKARAMVKEMKSN